MEKVPPRVPSVEDLIGSAKAGRFVDRMDEYLPDEFFTSRGVPPRRVKRSFPVRKRTDGARLDAAVKSGKRASASSR